MRRPAERRLVAAIMAAAALLYAAAGRLYRVGVISDDSIYILAARSLLSGRYVALNLPSHPPLLSPPPGFPLALVPWVGWMPLASLKLVPFLLMLSSVLLFWRLSGRWFPPAGSALLTGFFAFNPWIVQSSTYVMSEPLFLLLMFSLALWFLRLIRSEQRLWELLLFGVCLGFAAWVRADGIALVAGMLLGLAVARRYRALLAAAGMSGLMIGTWACRNALAHSTQPGYGHSWYGLLMTDRSPSQTLLAQGAWLYRIYGQGVLGLRVASGTAAIVIAGFFVVIAFLLTILGLRHELRKHEPESILVLSLSVFAFFYSILHILWISDEVRYAMPLIPLILLACGRAALTPFKRLGRLWNRVLLALAIGVGASNVVADATLVRISFLGGRLKFPEASFAWLHNHLESNSFVLASAPATVTLYTGLNATNFAPARDAEAFRYGLLEGKIDHVLYEVRAWSRMALPMDDEATVWRHRLFWMQSWPAAFTLIYRNEDEQNLLFSVKPNAMFQGAYHRAQEAMERIETSDYSGALQAAEDSMRMDPRLLTARNAYAVAALLSGSHRKQADRVLREAIRISPTYAVGHLNLARLLRQRGERAAASTEYQLALNAIAATGEFTSLIPRIRSEQAENELK